MLIIILKEIHLLIKVVLIQILIKLVQVERNKKHIGTNTKNLLLDYDLSKYELISIVNNTNNNNNIVGRIINFRKDNETSNFIIDYALLSDNNFEIGDIFKSNTTNSNYMIIPEIGPKIIYQKTKI